MQLQQINVPNAMKQRYMKHLENKNSLWDSQIAYDTWFYQYYGRYQDFTLSMKKQLLENVEYFLKVATEVTTANFKQGGSNKKLYDITYNGLKMMEMTVNKEARQYYILIEEFVQNSHLQMIEEQKKQITQLQFNSIRIGRIYKMYNKYIPDMIYIGKTTQKLSTRLSQHKSKQKVKCNTEMEICAWKLYWKDCIIELIEEITFVQDIELNTREKYYINMFQPQLNIKHMKKVLKKSKI